MKKVGECHQRAGVAGSKYSWVGGSEREGPWQNPILILGKLTPVVS